MFPEASFYSEPQVSPDWAITDLVTIDQKTGEEGGGGKAIMLKRGGYSDMHACLMFVARTWLL